MEVELEESRRMLELRELDAAMQHIRPQIEGYLLSDDGTMETKAVAAEMKRLRALEVQAVSESAGDLSPRRLKALARRERVRGVFESFDADGSGTMDASELHEFMDELCLPVDEEEVAEIAEDMDEDGSGDIDFDEFYHW
jgi:hypothetical protein